MNTYVDENGYVREKPKHSNLIHRKIAYREIYLKHRDKYPRPFKEYIVHHIDGNKRNNKINNLVIMTQEDHEEIHGYSKNKKLDDFEEKKESSWGNAEWFLLIFILFLVLNALIAMGPALFRLFFG